MCYLTHVALLKIIGELVESIMKEVIFIKQNKNFKDFLNFWGLSDSLTEEDKVEALFIVARGFKTLFYYNVFSSMIAFLAYTQHPKITIFIYICANIFVTVYCVGFNILYQFKKVKLKKSALFNDSIVLSKSSMLIKSLLSGVLFAALMESYFLLIGKNQINEILTPFIMKRISIETGVTIIVFYIMQRVMAVAQKNSNG